MSKKKNKTIQAKLIANPGSGTSSDRGKLLEQVTRYLKDEGIKVDVAIAKPKEKTIPIARKAVKDGYKVIIAMGGDDTIEAIIQECDSHLSCGSIDRQEHQLTPNISCCNRSISWSYRSPRALNWILRCSSATYSRRTTTPGSK